jgi:hypothetical protein
VTHYARWRIGVLLCACLQVAACVRPGSATEEDEAAPAKVEHLDGPQPTRVTLTEDAARRLDIQIADIRDMAVDGRLRTVVPYAAVLYDTEGGTWVYTSPRALVFLRDRIEVDFITGDLAVLSRGPSSGTSVVTVGAQELYGSELEFEEE